MGGVLGAFARDRGCLDFTTRPTGQKGTMLGQRTGFQSIFMLESDRPRISPYLFRNMQRDSH